MYTEDEFGNKVPTAALAQHIGTLAKSAQTLDNTGAAVTLASYYDTVNNTYYKTTDNKYYLYLEDVRMDGTSFDVAITLDGSKYTDTVDGDGNVTAAATSGQNYNSMKTIALPTIDGNYCAIVSGAGVYDDQAVQALKLFVEDPVRNYTFSAANVERCILITLNEEKVNVGMTGEWQTSQKVTAEYIYRYKDGATTVHELSYTDIVFTNQDDTSIGLKGIYVWYPPEYGWKTDEIKLNLNTTDIDGRVLPVSIIKQQTNSNVDTLEPAELNYHVNVRINLKKDGADITDTDKNIVAISTNLGKTFAGTVVPSQANYYFGNAAITPANSETMFGLSSLANEAAVDRLMDVTVEVFLHGTGNAPEVKSTAGEAYNDYVNNVTGELKETMYGTLHT